MLTYIHCNGCVFTSNNTSSITQASYAVCQLQKYFLAICKIHQTLAILKH